MLYKTLKSAAISGNIYATKYFLEKGYNPGQKVSSGTLLQFAIQRNHTDIAISGFYQVARLLHPAFQTMFINQPSSFFKSDQYTIKNGEKIEVGINPSFVTGVQKFTS